MDIVGYVLLIVFLVWVLWYMNMLDKRARARQRWYDDVLLFICSHSVNPLEVAEFRSRIEKLRLTPWQLVRYNFKHRNDGADK